MRACDNLRNCHDPITIDEDHNVLRVFCKECKHTYYIRKDPFKGVPYNREYIKIVRRETLQPNQNLFYKYYPQHLKI